MTPAALDQAIIDACVPLWRECNVLANSRRGGTKRGNDTGRNHAVEESPDRLLASHGITFGGDRALWLAYERAIRKQALAGRPKRAPSKPRPRRPFSDIERARIAARLREGAGPKRVAAEFGRSLAQVYEIRREVMAPGKKRRRVA